MRPPLLAGVLLLLLAAPLLAEEEEAVADAPPAAPAQPSGPVFFFKLAGGLIEQLESDLEEGGSFRADRWYIQPGVDVFLSREFQVSLGVGFGEEHYRFFGDRGLAGVDPWDNVQSFSLRSGVRYGLDEKWTAFGAANFSWFSEEGASFTDGFTLGLFGGAAWKSSETLTIGPGLGLNTQIEDRPVIFPFLLIDWTIAERWSLSTGSGLAATRGPGLVLSYQLADHWRIGLGSRWEQYRFRLDDDGPSPEGVGEEGSVPAYLGLSWEPTWRTRVSLLAGVNFSGLLALYDEDGDLIRREDYDPAPFVGIVFDIGL